MTPSFHNRRRPRSVDGRPDRRGALLALVLLSAAGPATATTLPGEPVSLQVRYAQERAEKAFEKGDYERARWHYRTVLAPAGDKYAHYMLGYLHEQGLGVPHDPARADEVFQTLRARYGDRTLLTRAIQRNERNLRRRTGTNTGGYTGPLFMVEPLRMGRVSNGDRYYEALEARIEMQTELLGGSVELGELELIDP